MLSNIKCTVILRWKRVLDKFCLNLNNWMDRQSWKAYFVLIRGCLSSVLLNRNIHIPKMIYFGKLCLTHSLKQIFLAMEDFSLWGRWGLHLQNNIDLCRFCNRNLVSTAVWKETSHLSNKDNSECWTVCASTGGSQNRAGVCCNIADQEHSSICKPRQIKEKVGISKDVGLLCWTSDKRSSPLFF